MKIGGLFIAVGIGVGLYVISSKNSISKLNRDEKANALRDSLMTDQKRRGYTEEVLLRFLGAYNQMFNKMSESEIDILFTFFFDYHKQGKPLNENHPLYSAMQTLRYRYPVLGE